MATFRRVPSYDRYLFSGGTLQISGGLANAGVLDFGGGSAVLSVAGSSLVDLSQGAIANPGSASVTIGPGSLLIVPSSFNAAGFRSFTNAGMTHTAGTTLTVPSGQGFGGWGAINDPIVCQGAIVVAPNGSLNLSGGLNLSGTGTVTLGMGSLTTNDATSRMTGGSLAMFSHYLGSSGRGSFTQSGGSSMVQCFYLGYDSGDSGMYNLSGTGILSATQYQYVGYSGTGSFTQSGGTSSVQGPLYLGYNAGASGTYTLSGGSPSIPYYNNNSLYVGYSGTGAFTQSGGTNASISLCLGYNAGSSGAYNLNGGTLVVPSISGGAGTAAFNFGGGTLLATGTFSVGVPMTLNAGVSTINASSGKTLALRPMTRNAGGTVDFNSNTTGTITTTQANTNGILGPWATYGSGTSMNYAAASGGSAPYTIVPYTGATTIASGVTGLTDTTGAVNYTLSSSGGTLTAAVSANTLQLTGTASTITASGANPLSLNGIMDVGSGTATIAGGNLIIGSNKELLFTGPGNVTVGATVRDNGSGASALTMAGGGTLLLGAANTYSGNTFISGGTLQLGNAAALPQGANAGNVFLSGTLDLNNLSANVNGLSGGGLVTSSAAGSPTLTVGSNNATSTFGGVIQNGSATSVALAKTGSGTLSLTGSNTYTGPTSINAGSLIADGSLASTAVMINGGATLGGTGSIGGSVTVAGGSSPSMWGTISLVDGAAGTLTLSDAMSTNTVLTIGGSTAGSSSFLDFEVGTSADRILIAAGKVLVNSGGGIINITPLAGFGPGTYDLMDFASNQASGLGYLSLATTSVDGYPLSLQSTPTAEQLVVAVPEPSTLALLAASAAGLLTYGWRRRR